MYMVKASINPEDSSLIYHDGVMVHDGQEGQTALVTSWMTPSLTPCMAIKSSCCIAAFQARLAQHTVVLQCPILQHMHRKTFMTIPSMCFLESDHLLALSENFSDLVAYRQR